MVQILWEELCSVPVDFHRRSGCPPVVPSLYTGCPKQLAEFHRVFHKLCTTLHRHTWVREVLSAASYPRLPRLCLSCLRPDPVRQFGDLVVDRAAFGHQPPDLPVRVHDGGVVPSTEVLADLR